MCFYGGRLLTGINYGGREDSEDQVLSARPPQSIYCKVVESQVPRLAN